MMHPRETAARIVKPFFITMYPPNENTALTPQLQLELAIEDALVEQRKKDAGDWHINREGVMIDKS